MAELKLTYKAHPSLEGFHRDFFHSTQCIWGPVGGGKSTAGLWKLIQVGLKSGLPAVDFAIVRQTYRELKDSTQKLIFEWFPPEEFGGYKVMDEIYTLNLNETRMRFYFRAVDRAEDVGKLKGTTFTGYWIDEASEVAKDVKLMLDQRARWPKNCFFYPGILTTNPTDINHWIWQDFEIDEEAEENGLKMYKQAPLENVENLRPGYYENLEKQYPAQWIKRYIHGEPGVLLYGQIYYPEFFETKHCGDFKPKISIPVQRGWDFGYRRAACIFSQVDRKGRWVVLDEVSAEDTTTAKFAQTVLDYSQKQFPFFVFDDYCDPAGKAKSSRSELTDIQILSKKGIFPRYKFSQRPDADYKARKEIISRKLSTICSAYGTPYLMVNNKCRFLKTAFLGGYCHEGDGITPIKDGTYEHFMDAFSYIAVNMFRVTEESKERKDRYEEFKKQQREQFRTVGIGGMR